MKVNMVLVIIIATALLLCPARTWAGQPVTVMVLGDSLSIGLGLSPGESWPEQLGELLAVDGLDVRMVNASVSGDTMGDGLARLGWALAENPDVCVVALGGNDGLRMLDVDRMETALDAILSELGARGIVTILVGMLPPPNFGQEYSREFAAVFPRMAKAHGVQLIPFLLQGVAGVAELNQPDGIHPTAKGAQIMALTVLPVVRESVLLVREK